jgi:hypothetical protein
MNISGLREKIDSSFLRNCGENLLEKFEMTERFEMTEGKFLCFSFFPLVFVRIQCEFPGCIIS